MMGNHPGRRRTVSGVPFLLLFRFFSYFSGIGDIPDPGGSATKYPYNAAGDPDAGLCKAHIGGHKKGDGKTADDFDDSVK